MNHTEIYKNYKLNFFAKYIKLCLIARLVLGIKTRYLKKILQLFRAALQTPSSVLDYNISRKRRVHRNIRSMRLFIK